jgi:hypothetical protein
LFLFPPFKQPVPKCDARLKDLENHTQSDDDQHGWKKPGIANVFFVHDYLIYNVALLTQYYRCKGSVHLSIPAKPSHLPHKPASLI